MISRRLQGQAEHAEGQGQGQDRLAGPIQDEPVAGDCRAKHRGDDVAQPTKATEYLLVATSTKQKVKEQPDKQGPLAVRLDAFSDFQKGRIDPALERLGSCVHLKNACAAKDDYGLLDVLERDVVASGDALRLH